MSGCRRSPGGGASAQATEDVAEHHASQPRLEGEETGLDLTTGGRHERLEPRLVAGLLELCGGGGVAATKGFLVARCGASSEVERDREEDDDGGEDEGDAAASEGQGGLTHERPPWPRWG